MQINLNGLNVMIAIPGGRNPDWDTAVDLTKTMLQLQAGNVPNRLTVRRSGIITKVRDRLVDDFLKSDCNRMFWIDDDMRWSVEDFMRLLALSTKFDCVAASYVARNDSQTFFVKTIPSPSQLNEFGLWEIEGIGLGFACMTREVVMAVARDKPLVFDQMEKNEYRMVFRTDASPEGNFRGEDMAFFADIRAAGFKVWCDPAMEIGHIGSREYRGRLMDVITEQQRVYAEQNPVEAAA